MKCDARKPPSCPCAELLRELADRVLVLEAAAGMPLSVADRQIAIATAQRLYEARFPGPPLRQ
jgi:hypothetical protein